MLCVIIVLRYCRYNISTQDYEAWTGEVSSANNTRGRDNALNLDVYSRFGLNGTEAEQVCCTNMPVFCTIYYFVLARLFV